MWPSPFLTLRFPSAFLSRFPPGRHRVPGHGRQQGRGRVQRRLRVQAARRHGYGRQDPQVPAHQGPVLRSCRVDRGNCVCGGGRELNHNCYRTENIRTIAFDTCTRPLTNRCKNRVHFVCGVWGAVLGTVSKVGTPTLPFPVFEARRLWPSASARRPTPLHACGALHKHVLHFILVGVFRAARRGQRARRCRRCLVCLVRCIVRSIVRMRRLQLARLGHAHISRNKADAVWGTSFAYARGQRAQQAPRKSPCRSESTHQAQRLVSHQNVAKKTAGIGDERERRGGKERAIGCMTRPQSTTTTTASTHVAKMSDTRETRAGLNRCPQHSSTQSPPAQV